MLKQSKGYFLISAEHLLGKQLTIENITQMYFERSVPTARCPINVIK